MDQSLFELIAAFIFWAFTGFKGKYEDRLGKADNVKNAYWGLFFVVPGLMLLVFLMRLLG